MRVRLLLVLAVGWLITSAGSGLCANERKLDGRRSTGSAALVVAVINQVTWHDLLSDDVQAPTLRKLASTGGVGMMCVRTARGGEGGYLTIGCGARAVVPRRPGMAASPEGWAFNVGEPVEGATAGRRYLAYTGSRPDDQAIVHLGIGDLSWENLPTSYPVHLGLLGGELARAGLVVTCVGNADTPLGRHREIVAMAMDEQGVVKVGEVGSALVHGSPALPSGVATDGPRFLEAFARASKVADVVFLELGETARAAEYADRMTPAEAVSARHRAVERSDRLLGKALSMMPEEGWAVMVVAPMVRPPDPEEQFAALAPIILGGPEARPGALTSPSTRRPGIVANTDVAATVLEYFGLPRPSDTVGRPMATVEVGEDTLAWLAAQVTRQDEVETARRHLFRWLPVVAAVGLWAAAVLLLLESRAPYWARMATRGVLVIMLAAPAAALLAGAYPMSAIVILGVVAGGAVLIALVSSWATVWRAGPVAPAVLLVGALLYDLVRGQSLLAWSPLSYSAASGARFYGLGNELAGAALGAALVGAAGMLGSRAEAGMSRRLAAGLILICLAVMVGHTGLGANAGMALACALGFGVFVLYLWRDEPGWREVLAVGVLVFGLVGAAIMVDVFLRSGQSSHLGLLVASVKAKGWPVLWQAVSRKMAMNVMLVRNSPWSDAAAGALALLLVAVAARSPRALAAVREQEWLQPAVVAAVLGAAAAFVLNDSGVVAGGMALMFGAGWLGYAALGGGRG